MNKSEHHVDNCKCFIKTQSDYGDVIYDESLSIRIESV